MLRSENVFDTISSGALPQSIMETKILSRSATSMYMHSVKVMSCNNKCQNTRSEKGQRSLYLSTAGSQ